MSDKDLRFYIQVDVGFWDHPKARAAGRNGRDLFLCALGYCRSQLTDGDIHNSVLELLAFKVGMTFDEAQAASDRLVDIGMWERTCDGWHVHDYEQHQQTKEDIEAQRAQWRRRQRDKRTRDQDKQPRHADVTGDSPVSHARVTQPESESESESESEITNKSSGPLNPTALADWTTLRNPQGTTDQRITLTLEHWAALQAERAGATGNRRKQYTQTVMASIDQHWAPLKALAQAHPHLDPTQLAELYRKPGTP